MTSWQLWRPFSLFIYFFHGCSRQHRQSEQYGGESRLCQYVNTSIVNMREDFITVWRTVMWRRSVAPVAPQESWDIGGHKCLVAWHCQHWPIHWCQQLSSRNRSRDTTPRRRRRAPLRSLTRSDMIPVTSACVYWLPLHCNWKLLRKSNWIHDWDTVAWFEREKKMNSVIVEMT